jgi:hypothetical protein
MFHQQSISLSRWSLSIGDGGAQHDHAYVIGANMMAVRLP